jgi:hypothetical protein
MLCAVSLCAVSLSVLCFAMLCAQEVSLEEASTALQKQYLRNNKVINLQDYVGS